MGIKKVLLELNTYLDDFHQGSVNIVIHFIGIAFFGYGIGIENWAVIMLAPIGMELGHAYNYIRGRSRMIAVQTIPLQIGFWFFFMGIAYAALEVLHMAR